MSSTRENQSFRELTATANELLPEFGSFEAAFQEACKRCPARARDAIKPDGKPLMPGTDAAASTQKPEKSMREVVKELVEGKRTTF